jgi:hypothetical protein
VRTRDSFSLVTRQGRTRIDGAHTDDGTQPIAKGSTMPLTLLFEDGKGAKFRWS